MIMMKKLFYFVFTILSTFAFSQPFTATYDFAATTTVSGTTDPTPPPVITGLTCGSFMAVGTPSSNPNAAGRFSFIGWPNGATTAVNTYSSMTGAINANEYYEVILEPQAGYTLTLNSIVFKVQRSGTGIRSYAVRTSADGFTSNLSASVSAGVTNISIVGNDEFFWNFDSITSGQSGSVVNLFGATTTSSVSFRFYGWNSEASSGTFSIDNVVFDGLMSNGFSTGLQMTVKDNFIIFPNPTSGVFKIKNQASNAQINVFDINGKKVFTQSTYSLENQVDLSDLANGVYQLNIVSDNQSYNHKLMINK